MSTEELKWGETPFDRMTQEELLVHAKRMYMALGSAYNELSKFRDMTLQQDPKSPYWTGDGYGNRAYQRVEQAWTKAQNGYGDENSARAYYRFADGFLFDPYPGNEKDSRFWMACSGCDSLQSTTADGIRMMTGKTHGNIFHGNKCQGILKQLTEQDLKPKP